MTKRAVVLMSLFALTMLIPSESFGEEEFSFYGLQFGMTAEEAKGHFSGLDRNVVSDPGHGISTLELYFDREERLMEIRAGYLNPEGKMEGIGLQRALRERFLAPVKESFPGISVTVDQYGNRAASTVIFQSTGIREKNIEHYKREYLSTME
jgi:hypothetical protein